MSGHFKFHYKGYDNGVLKKSSFYCEGVFYLITFSHLRKSNIAFARVCVLSLATHLIQRVNKPAKFYIPYESVKVYPKTSSCSDVSMYFRAKAIFHQVLSSFILFFSKKTGEELYFVINVSQNILYNHL